MINLGGELNYKETETHTVNVLAKSVSFSKDDVEFKFLDFRCELKYRNS